MSSAQAAMSAATSGSAYRAWTIAPIWRSPALVQRSIDRAVNWMAARSAAARSGRRS
ncbi:hypothetical protein [Streptomyces jumonjinensis]|uniref:hypothetical protein n=1 Tax=Streptomyces jumonjinensis TaxID=1945 RepID=UPI0012982071|nr:hypothetical protein [Streptomyces jumonjinensis]